MEQLNRTQRRVLERINREAQSVYSKLCEQYYVCFMDNDPNGPEVKAKGDELEAKWLMYSKNRGLTDEGKGEFRKYIDNIHKDFNDIKNDKAQN